LTILIDAGYRFGNVSATLGVCMVMSMKRPSRLLVAVLLLTSTLVVGSATPSSAEPQCLAGVVQILPAAKTGQAPPWQWAFANGSQGVISRYANSYPCVNDKANAWTVNMSLTGGNNFFEVGYYESPGGPGGADQYNVFFETVVGGSLTFQITNAPCGPHPPSGSSGFRVRRYWSTTWVGEIDCSNSGAWQQIWSTTFPANPDWGNAQAEMERFSRDNSYNILFTQLKWRRFNDPNGVWNPWVGMGCIYTPVNFTQQNLHLWNNSSFDFVSGTGTC
jgi:hypothetical protein